MFTAHLPKSAVLDYWRFKINEKSPPLFLPHPGEKFKFLFKKLPTIASFAENTFYLSKSKRLESFIFKALDILNSIIVEGLLFPDSILPIYV
jgi:hypothetical protein